MLTALPTVKVEWLLIDRDKRRAQMIMHLPFVLTVAQLATFISTMHPLITALVDCTIYRVNYRYQLNETDTTPAVIGSNSRYLLALFYSNPDRFEALYIPSPIQDYLETTGLYAGTRLDTSLSAVQDALADLTSGLALVVTPEGDPHPTTFVVGGLAV